MEKIPYPTSYFDPFGDEPRRSKCDRCGKVFDIGDLSKVGSPGCYEWLCDECLEGAASVAAWAEDEE